MKKFLLSLFLLLILFGYTNSQKPTNQKVFIYRNVTTDTTKKYFWYGKILTKQQYLDTLEKKFKSFNDSLRKAQGIISSK